MFYLISAKVRLQIRFPTRTFLFVYFSDKVRVKMSFPTRTKYLFFIIFLNSYFRGLVGLGKKM